jgi:hypothetical protein
MRGEGYHFDERDEEEAAWDGDFRGASARPAGGRCG